MALKNINPTQAKSWKKLEDHYNEIKDIHLKSLKNENPNRVDEFSIQFNDFHLDYSNNRISKKTLTLLISLAKEAGLEDAISKCFSGKKINKTENRAVLHTALRDSNNPSIYLDNKDISLDIKQSHEKLQQFSDAIISGKRKGYSGKAFTDIVNIGIGGSDLGPNMVVESLKYYKNHLKLHFISNVDGDHVQEVIKELNPETTLFVIVSKTFTTQETITNANTVRNWFLKSANNEAIGKHFVAVSTNLKSVQEFGIEEENIFTMWDWVGGRFSLWSSVGLSICLAIGFKNFKELLSGASEMDEHFKTTPFNKNIPVILSLIGIWYNNFFNSETEVVLPYSQCLNLFPTYLQQASMESNGKSIDRNGEKIDYQTGSIIWGSSGTNSQHAYMQLVHQGTKLIPADFIGFQKPLYNNKEHHEKLMSNFHAQSEALAFGKTKEQVHLDLKFNGKLKEIEKLLPFKVFEGNKPSNKILINKLTPRSLGSLIAMYEHKIFTQGIIWNIFSFDQFGVELGKELAHKIYSKSKKKKK